MSLLEDDPLAMNLPSYTFHEIRQLERMTQELIDHYAKMLKEWTTDGPANLKKALEMSLELAENDMKEIQAEIAVRKEKNESDAPPPPSSPIPDDDESDSGTVSSQDTNSGTSKR